jgi:hypothetical protein
MQLLRRFGEFVRSALDAVAKALDPSCPKCGNPGTFVASKIFPTITGGVTTYAVRNCPIHGEYWTSTLPAQPL